MRKPVKAYDADHRSLVEERSVVRYMDTLWIYHGAWVDNETGKVKLLLSSRRTGKMILVHDKHRHEVHLEFTVEEN
jgi:hypothetical protein